jgi:hypothetical protein
MSHVESMMEEEKYVQGFSAETWKKKKKERKKLFG